jgi:hypothetical protein
MLKNLSKVMIGVCAVSNVALANGGLGFGGDYTPTDSYAKGGFVVGIDGGYGYLNSPDPVYPKDFSILPVSYDQDNSSGHFVWGAHIGYDFKVLQNFLFGCELGYKDLGESNRSARVVIDTDYVNASKDYDQQAIDLLATAHYYPWKGLNFFAKAGVAYVRSSIDQAVSTSFTINDVPVNLLLEPLNGSFDVWKPVPEFSLGFGYTFENKIDVHVAYTYTGSSGDSSTILPEESRVYETSIAMFGISYTF